MNLHIGLTFPSDVSPIFASKRRLANRLTFKEPSSSTAVTSQHHRINSKHHPTPRPIFQPPSPPTKTFHIDTTHSQPSHITSNPKHPTKPTLLQKTNKPLATQPHFENQNTSPTKSLSVTEKCTSPPPSSPAPPSSPPPPPAPQPTASVKPAAPRSSPHATLPRALFGERLLGLERRRRFWRVMRRLGLVLLLVRLWRWLRRRRLDVGTVEGRGVGWDFRGGSYEGFF